MEKNARRLAMSGVPSALAGKKDVKRACAMVSPFGP